MRRSLYFFVILLCGGLISGQGISKRKLLRKIEKISQLNKAFVGLTINDLDKNKTLASLNADRYMTPASNIKLLTFLGAIQTFSKIPSLEYFKESDSIYHFKSTGYPLLLHPFYPDSILFNFFKDKKTWLYHPSENIPLQFGSGWSWDDYNYYFAAPKSVFPIYGNSVTGVIVDSEAELTPSFPVNKDNSIRNFERHRFDNQFQFNPKNWKSKDTIYRPFIPSDSLFIKLLREATNAKVYFAKGKDSLEWKTLYTGNEELLYKGLLHDSDNGIAEALLLMIANKQKGVFKSKVAINSLTESWESWIPDKIQWVDGSGISRYNMTSPRTLVAVLHKIEERLPWEKIQILFPKSGFSGTIKAYRGLDNVYAKTGTLRNNHNLLGYWISAKGKRYAFSIMVNHFIRPNEEIREGITELLTWIQRKLK